jgi:hypothetical protein
MPPKVQDFGGMLGMEQLSSLHFRRRGMVEIESQWTAR